RPAPAGRPAALVVRRRARRRTHRQPARRAAAVPLAPVPVHADDGRLGPPFGARPVSPRHRLGRPARCAQREPVRSLPSLHAPRAAERAFERGDVDEAPVPTGEVAGARARLGNVVETRTLLALDGVALRRLMPALRRAYWDTANRSDYADLLSEARGAAASSV